MCSRLVKPVRPADESAVLTKRLSILADVTTTPLSHPATQVKGYERTRVHTSLPCGSWNLGQFVFIHRSMYRVGDSDDLWAFQPTPWKGRKDPAPFSWMWQLLAYCQFSHSPAVSSCIQPPSQWENSSLVAFLHSLHSWEVLQDAWKWQSDSLD